MVEKLTITALYSAIKECKLKVAEESIQHYGIPKNGKKTTDYLLLQTALERNHKDVAKLLIKAGCRTKPTDNESGWTPLAWTVIKENIDIAMMLLNKGAEHDAGNNSGLTVLHLAVRKKSLSMVRLLLCYVKVNLIDSKGKTVLQTFFEVVCNQINVDQASLANNVEILNLLISKGASLTFENNPIGFTPLHYAVKSKQVGLINIIIQETNNVNVISNSTGDTALHILLSDKNSYKRDCLDIIKLLVNNGVNINVSNNQNETLLHIILSRHHANEEYIIEIIQYLVEKGANINAQNYRKESACHLAARKKYLRVFQFFLQCHCQINLQDYESNTILHRFLQNSTNFRLNDAFVELAYAVLTLEPLLEIKNSDGKTPLDLAIQNKQSKLLVRMLPESTAVNAVDENGNTLLYIYLKDLIDKNCKIDDGYTDVIESFLLSGANVDLANKTNETPVQLACKLNNDKILLQVLKYSSNLDTIIGEKNRTVLHILSQHKKKSSEIDDIKAAEVGEFCLKKGATIDFKDDVGLTPLCIAVMTKQKHMVKVLLENNADPNSIITTSEATVLEYLLNVEKEHSEVDLEIAGLLLSHGAIVNENPDSKFSILHYVTLPNRIDMCLKLIAYSHNVNIIDASQNTALHNLLLAQSATDENTEEKVHRVAVQLLLKGDLIEAKNNQGMTPLHLAAERKFYTIIKVLLEHGADPTVCDNLGNSALHFLGMKVCKTRQDLEKDIVRLLVRYGCDVNMCNKSGATPLLIATLFGCTDLVKALIRYRADVDLSMSEDLLTPLHVAAEHNRTVVARQLIKYGANVLAKTNDGKTALHIAVIHKKIEIVEILLKNRADVNMKEDFGINALFLACWYPNFDIVKKLLNCGADINIMNFSDETPLDISQNIILDELVNHVKKLKAANMFVLQKNTDHFAVRYEHDAFDIEAKKEVTQLETMKINNQRSLADVLRMSQSRLAIFKNNEDFQKHVNSDDFIKMFPYYGNLVKACYVRGVIRSDLLAYAKMSFRKLLEIPLPDICCDLIFDFLTNDSLQDLVAAARLKNNLRKRRRMDDDDEVYGGAPSAIRVRKLSV